MAKCGFDNVKKIRILSPKAVKNWNKAFKFLYRSKIMKTQIKVAEVVTDATEREAYLHSQTVRNLQDHQLIGKITPFLGEAKKKAIFSDIEGTFSRLKNNFPFLCEQIVYYARFKIFTGRGLKVLGAQFFQSGHKTSIIFGDVGMKEQADVDRLLAMAKNTKRLSVEHPFREVIYKNYIACPIFYDSLHGVIVVQNDRTKTNKMSWARGERPVVINFMEIAASALSRAKNYLRDCQKSSLDAVTLLRSRMSFFKDLTAKMRKKEKFSLLLIDIDRFSRLKKKSIFIADNSLWKAAEVVKQITKDDEADEAMRYVKGKLFSYRYEGGSFMIIAPEYNAEQARKVAERIRRSLAREIFRGKNKDEKIPFSVSVGVVEWTGKSKPIELMRKVEKTLQKAKRKGRNRVEIASSEKKEKTEKKKKSNA